MTATSDARTAITIGDLDLDEGQAERTAELVELHAHIQELTRVTLPKLRKDRLLLMREVHGYLTLQQMADVMGIANRSQIAEMLRG